MLHSVTCLSRYFDTTSHLHDPEGWCRVVVCTVQSRMTWVAQNHTEPRTQKAVLSRALAAGFAACSWAESAQIVTLFMGICDKSRIGRLCCPEQAGKGRRERNGTVSIACGSLHSAGGSVVQCGWHVRSGCTFRAGSAPPPPRPRSRQPRSAASEACMC